MTRRHWRHIHTQRPQPRWKDRRLRIALIVIPFVDPAVGVIAFVAALILKGSVNRIGDLLDNGKTNQSFRA